MNLYQRMAEASKGLYDLSKSSTDAHMTSETADINAAWAQSTEDITAISSNFQSSAASTYRSFDAQRNTDHEAMLADILTNVIGEVTDAVAELVLSDLSFDKQLAANNSKYADAWAEIGKDEGTVAVDFILA